MTTRQEKTKQLASQLVRLQMVEEESENKLEDITVMEQLIAKQRDHFEDIKKRVLYEQRIIKDEMASLYKDAPRLIPQNVKRIM